MIGTTMISGLALRSLDHEIEQDITRYHMPDQSGAASLRFYVIYSNLVQL